MALPFDTSGTGPTTTAIEAAIVVSNSLAEVD
jgi:hypothetical protein